MKVEGGAIACNEGHSTHIQQAHQLSSSLTDFDAHLVPDGTEIMDVKRKITMNLGLGNALAKHVRSRSRAYSRSTNNGPSSQNRGTGWHNSNRLQMAT